MQLQEVIDRTPWIPSWHETGASMDRRHCLWIYELLVRLKPQRTLEIGSYHGCSSSAFIAAGVPDAHFADITVSQRMREVIGDKGAIHQRKGCDVIWESEPFEVVLVDGAHDMESVMEELAALVANPPKIIIAHDINSPNIGFENCEGAGALMDFFKTLYPGEDWDGYTDIKHREGEMTDRGVCMLTKEIELMPLMWDAKKAAGCS